LDLNLDTLEGLLDGVLGTGVHHLRLGLGSIRGPHEEDDLGASSIRSSVIIELQDGIAAVISGELSQEVRIRGRGIGGLDEGDGLVIVGETQDHVTVLVTELEVVELRDDRLVDSNTSGLDIFWIKHMWVRMRQNTKKAGENLVCSAADLEAPFLATSSLVTLSNLTKC